MGEQRSTASNEEVLARIAWSRLTEPRDRAAGLLLATLGAVEALHWLDRARQPIDRAGALAEVSGIDPEVDAKAWSRAVARWAPRLRDLDPRRELQVITRLGGSVLIPGDPAWPPGLDDLGPEAPHCLWTRGDPALLAMPAVAVVGSRASTAYGNHVSAELVAGLVDGGRAVVSGGAFGIDATAHRATLAVHGTPVAVMAGGLDRFYPAANAAMLTQVAQEGVVVSEAPPGTAPMRQRFLSRNRLIAALAGATVVVEASWRSGALSTAHHALTIGRPLAAVPGPITSAASAGCHRLLREGAECVTAASEVLQLLAPLGSVAEQVRDVPAGLLDDLDQGQAQVLDALPVRAAVDESALVRASGLSQAQVRSALGYLELAGRVRRDGPRWRRAGS
ncbi:DNA-protecting protein DprA [Ruania alkalisoli]|uniref:DNA-protecting protein DprA n=1 Tax=Ruania alkalisoli TaxID=2779775 RepID=A0A7M1SWV9_9MICO|nr:DNA-processing protein DprA [Ruania alkalisoli]QOR72076.1 DNA-protecting protein DprA [Ruania alkalisoli]